MNMKIEPETREFKEVIDELNHCTVIVEGKNDANALKKLGVNIKNIVKINSRPLAEVVYRISETRKATEVVILTDFDQEGRRIASRLRVLLQRYKIHVNSSLRRSVMRFGRTRIEDLKNIIKEDDHYGKVGTDFHKISHKSENKNKRYSRKTRRDRGDFWSN
ncbi:MAG: hypothetical protein DRP15_02410 [Candidatus Aenigmatarchaeota archaeon]|nr:MAG: hypothetical protein DRP15_02410 [Candidatus Aenigmarchaeota archaeon]